MYLGFASSLETNFQTHLQQLLSGSQRQEGDSVPLEREGQREDGAPQMHQCLELFTNWGAGASAKPQAAEIRGPGQEVGRGLWL